MNTNTFLTVKALVIREVRYKEADRILTLYTEENGKMTAKASNALRKTSKIAAATQLLTYAEMVLYCNKGHILVREANIIEDFSGLKEDFSNYALGCYFAECVDNLTEEETAEKDILQLALNSLYALSHNLYDPKVIKAGFEMRMMSKLGYRPNTNECNVCGKVNPDEPCLGIVSGIVCCRKCRNSQVGLTSYLDDESLRAIRHITTAGPKNVFPKNITGESLEKLSEASEKYFIEHTERRFPTLDYWKKL